MQLRESGMPPQDYWETLFDVPAILDAFGFNPDTGDVAELGCGYGTFTLPLATRIRGTVHALDFDPAMVATTQARATATGLNNIRTATRDVLREGFGVPPASCDGALLFNILHGEEPVAQLRLAREAVRPGGLIAVIHWRSDVPTPRGPSLEIRPRPAQLLAWAKAAGGLNVPTTPLSLPPRHYGLALTRSSTD